MTTPTNVLEEMRDVKDLKDLDDVRSEVKKRGRQATSSAREAVKKARGGLVEAGYAAVGTGAALVDSGRRAVEQARSLPDTAKRARSRVPGVVADRFESLAKRGRQALGNGARKPGVRYEDRTVDELRDLAAERDIEGRSNMTKDQLIAALRDGG